MMVNKAEDAGKYLGCKVRHEYFEQVVVGTLSSVHLSTCSIYSVIGGGQYIKIDYPFETVDD